MRLALAILTCAACSEHTVPAHPSVSLDFGSYAGGYPIAVGTLLRVSTSWSGECLEHISRIPLPGLVEGPTERTVSCDEKSYALKIECREPVTTIAPRCRIREGHGEPVDDTLVQTSVRGTHYFNIEVVGVAPLAITVTVSRDGESKIHQSPLIQPVVVKELVAECRVDGEPADTARPCERDVLPKDRSIWVTVRSGGNAPPFRVSASDLRVNGHPQLDGKEFLLIGVVRPAAYSRNVPEGDYELVLEANPAPHTVKRTLTVHVH